MSTPWNPTPTAAPTADPAAVIGAQQPQFIAPQPQQAPPQFTTPQPQQTQPQQQGGFLPPQAQQTQAGYVPPAKVAVNDALPGTIVTPAPFVQGDRVNLKEDLGSHIVMRVHEHHPSVTLKSGEVKEAFEVSWIVLDGQNAGAVRNHSWQFGAAVVRDIKKSLSSAAPGTSPLILGVVGTKPSKYGQDMVVLNEVPAGDPSYGIAEQAVAHYQW